MDVKTLVGSAVGKQYSDAHADLSAANLLSTRPRSSAITCRTVAGDADTG